MKLAAIDIETWGDLPEHALQPYRLRRGEAYITSVAAVDADGVEWATLNPTKDQIQDWLQAQAASGARVVGHNTAFDTAWFLAWGLRDEVYAIRWLDTLLMWRHLCVRPDFAMPEGTKQSFSLKNAVRQYLPEYADYEKDVSFDPSVDPGRLLEYNKLDATLTLQLAHIFWDRMTPKMKRLAQIEAASIPMVAERMVEGLHIDTNAARELDNKLEGDANGALVRLMFLAGTSITHEVLASPRQLGELMYREWGLLCPKATATGAASTDKETLWMLSHEDPRAKLVKEHREAVGNRKKFAQNVLDSVAYNGDGQTRPQPRIYATYTGRMTYSSKQGKGKSERRTGFAIHQMKRDPAFRRIIIPPPGYKLLEFDFAGQEFRWMAVMSQDPVMLKLCTPGEDPHAYMGAQIAGWPYEALRKKIKEEDPEARRYRQRGKVANLALQYRTGAKRLRIVSQVQYDLPMTEDEAVAIHLTYRSTYRCVPRYWQRQIRHLKANGYVENLIGRRVYLGFPHEWNPSFSWSYESTSINFPIQSIGAEQKYLAMLVLREALKEYDGQFYLDLHDGLFVVVPNDKAQRAAVRLKHLLSNLPYKAAWDYTPPIPMPVDAKMGNSWGDLKEVQE